MMHKVDSGPISIQRVSDEVKVVSEVPLNDGCPRDNHGDYPGSPSPGTIEATDLCIVNLRLIHCGNEDWSSDAVADLEERGTSNDSCSFCVVYDKGKYGSIIDEIST